MRNEMHAINYCRKMCIINYYAMYIDLPAFPILA